MSSVKRHFTVVIGKKEHGLYVSSSPSSAARKAVTKLCATDKKKKVEFYIREITQGSKKKVYGIYSGYIEKLKEPIELKGRVIKYKSVAKLSKLKVSEGKKKNKKMRGGGGTHGIILDCKTYNIRDFIAEELIKISENIEISKMHKQLYIIFNEESNNANKKMKDSINQKILELKNNDNFTIHEDGWTHED
jgi:hypothetical protein